MVHSDMNKYLKCFFLTISILFLSLSESNCSHIRGGYLTANRIDNNSLTYEFTFVGYRDTDTGIQFGNGDLSFGDGQFIVADFTISEVSIGDNLVREEFRVVHTFNLAGTYTVSYREEFRNNGIANIPTSNSAAFYVETVIAIDPFLGISNTVSLVNDPIFNAETGTAYFFAPEVTEEDGDIIRFSLDNPRESRFAFLDYRYPNDDFFYSSNLENQSQDGSSTLRINPLSGLITWDSPGDFYNLNEIDCPNGEGNCAEYIVAFRISEFREVRGIRYLVSSTLVDYQIIVSEPNQPETSKIFIEDFICKYPNDVLTFTTTSASPYQLTVSPENLVASVNGISYDPSLFAFLQGEELFEIQFNPIEIESTNILYLKIEDIEDPLGSTTFPSDAPLLKSHLLAVAITEECDAITEELVTSIPGSDEFMLYPNPVEAVLHTDIYPSGFRIFDLQGQLVESGATSINGQVDVSELLRGAYLIELEAPNGTTRKKFIKE